MKSFMQYLCAGCLGCASSHEPKELRETLSTQADTWQMSEGLRLDLCAWIHVPGGITSVFGKGDPSKGGPSIIGKGPMKGLGPSKGAPTRQKVAICQYWKADRA